MRALDKFRETAKTENEQLILEILEESSPFEELCKTKIQVKELTAVLCEILEHTRGVKWIEHSEENFDDLKQRLRACEFEASKLDEILGVHDE